MIGPKKKRSKAKKRQQKHMWMTKQIKKLDARINIVACSNCEEKKLAHRVCPHCGRYKGKQLITISSGGEKAIEA